MKQAGCKVFISYCHKDKNYLDRIQVHLALLKRNGDASTWCDREMKAGDELDVEIQSQLESADLILLLISADFLNSSYCYQKEMLVALERHDRGEARVVPIIAKACSWKDTAIGKLLALPEDGKPIQTITTKESAYAQITDEIKIIVKQINESKVDEDFLASKAIERIDNAKAKEVCEKPSALVVKVGQEDPVDVFGGSSTDDRKREAAKIVKFFQENGGERKSTENDLFLEGFRSYQAAISKLQTAPDWDAGANKKHGFDAGRLIRSYQEVKKKN